MMFLKSEDRIGLEIKKMEALSWAIDQILAPSQTWPAEDGAFIHSDKRINEDLTYDKSN